MQPLFLPPAGPPAARTAAASLPAPRDSPAHGGITGASGLAADLPPRLRTEPAVAARRTRPVTRPPRALTACRGCPEAAAGAEGARDSARRRGGAAFRRSAVGRGYGAAPRPPAAAPPGRRPRSRRGPQGVPSPPLGAAAPRRG